MDQPQRRDRYEPRESGSQQQCAGVLRRGFLLGIGAAVATATPAFASAPALLTGAGGYRSLALVNNRTGEWLKSVYWVDGEYIPDALSAFNHILRDWREGPTPKIVPATSGGCNRGLRRAAGGVYTPAMQIARRIAAVLVLVALSIGASVLMADARHAAEFGSQMSLDQHAPGDCDDCSGDGEAMSASSCFVGCLGVHANAESGVGPEGSAGALHIRPEQRAGGAKSPPERHPPRLTILT